MSGRADRPDLGGPYETEQQARADVADVYEQSRRSGLRGALTDVNYGYLTKACERAGVALGAYDDRILTWLANSEPETCAVLAGLITRAHSSALARSAMHYHDVNVSADGQSGLPRSRERDTRHQVSKERPA